LKSVGGYLSINSNASLPALKSVGGSLNINSNASLPALKSVGGSLNIYSGIGEKLEKQLWKHNPKNKWTVSDACSGWLLSRDGKFTYQIANVGFSKSLFDAVRRDSLTAQEVFVIENIEQRRIAYERMDKIKMRDLPDLKILDDIIDAYGNPMRIVSFNLAGFKEPFKYLNCICPSSGREYYIETKQNKCEAAKAQSFGLRDVQFEKEW
jgi:hypothetical protein